MIEVDYKKLGDRIRTARENMNLTQEKLAEITGLSNNYISNIERNQSIPSLDTLVKICNALETTPDRVLLDSIYSSKEYIRDDIAKKLAKCSDKSMLLISSLIDVVIEQQDK
jgi:transcriptional regulator with XRE-family HTH domain